MSPKPFATSNSQYDDPKHAYDPECTCDRCDYAERLELSRQWLAEKPGLNWPLAHWLRLLAISLLIVALFLGAGYAARALAKAPQPILRPAGLLQAKAQCPDDASLTECRAALRRALSAVAWQRSENLKLAREMLGRLTDWKCIHGHEGSWTANTGNGYHGGLQMDWPFMRTYGRDMLKRHGGRGAEAWTPREQIIVAQRAFNQGRGYAPWPNTSRACGLR